MKLLIVGSRSIKEFDLSPYVSREVDTIISGGALRAQINPFSTE